MNELHGLLFCGFVLLFGAVMYLISPRTSDDAGFFHGHDEQGRAPSEWALMMSVFISWIFAKSVPNAANLGAAYGIVVFSRFSPDESGSYSWFVDRPSCRSPIHRAITPCQAGNAGRYWVCLLSA